MERRRAGSDKTDEDEIGEKYGGRFLVEAVLVGHLALEPALGDVGVLALVTLQGRVGDRIAESERQCPHQYQDHRVAHSLRRDNA